MIPKFDKYIEIAQCLIDKPESKNKHFAFIVQKNKIKSIGWNFSKKTHTLALEHKYEYPFVHAELSAITRFPDPIKELCNCYIINVRLSKNGIPMLSKPCRYCLPLLRTLHLKQIWFTNKQGTFEVLK